MNLAIARRPSVSEKVVHQPDGPESGVLRRATNVRQTPLGSNGAPGKTWDLQVELMLAGGMSARPRVRLRRQGFSRLHVAPNAVGSVGPLAASTPW